MHLKVKVLVLLVLLDLTVQLEHHNQQFVLMEVLQQTLIQRIVHIVFHVQVEVIVLEELVPLVMLEHFQQIQEQYLVHHVLLDHIVFVVQL